MFCQEPDRGRNRVLPTGVIRPGITSYRSGSNTYPLVLEYRCIVKISRIFHKSNVSSRIQPEADPDITNCLGTLRDNFLSIWIQHIPSRSRIQNELMHCEKFVKFSQIRHVSSRNRRKRTRVLPTGMIRPGITFYRSGSNAYPFVLEYRCIVKNS